VSRIGRFALQLVKCSLDCLGIFVLKADNFIPHFAERP
jgi:hypothetical protein